MLFSLLTSLLCIGSGQELVEDVEGTFIFGLANRTRFLQKIRLDIGTGDVARSVKVDSDKLALYGREKPSVKTKRQKQSYFHD